MHPLAPNQTHAKQVLSRRCAKSSYKTKMNKMECAVCYDMKNIVKINCNHGFCKPCLKKLLRQKKMILMMIHLLHVHFVEEMLLKQKIKV